MKYSLLKNKRNCFTIRGVIFKKRYSDLTVLINDGTEAYVARSCSEKIVNSLNSQKQSSGCVL